MVHKLLKIYIFVVILLTDFIMFADDDPGTGFEDEGGDTDGSVEDAAPINGKLLWLAVAGIAFIYFNFRKRQQELQGK